MRMPEHTGFAPEAERAKACIRGTTLRHQAPKTRPPGRVVASNLHSCNRSRMRIRQLRDATRQRQKSAKRATPDSAGADEAGTLFRQAIGEVRPLARNEETATEARKPVPQARQFEIDEAAVREELLSGPFDPGSIEMGDEILYLKPGHPARLLKQLRRGHFSIQAEIDLHQMSVAVARAAVAGFIDEAIRHREYCVRIVHGKGLRSAARGPVVKRMTEQLLRRRNDVVAFASALPAQGGTGAVLVLLQRD
ncbi:DNA-nicking endonuclease, Smr domain [Dokdonella immobilis]|uniref:DNA-nicking endonuclease, Smr domain n=1 Tax=Dokdonella immobilis TaxID=578942 RepID=A0A1I4V4R1_9GAMM|nr:DNA-nicking endonuclease, Smr domain [Dokdonella immobilis]